MAGPVLRYTKGYGFRIINFDFIQWHRYEQENWDDLDAILRAYVSSGLRGVWKNSTLYEIGDKVVDDETAIAYVNTVEHVSAASGTFEDDRTLHPTYWAPTSFIPSDRGEWATATNYVPNEYVSYGYKYAVILEAHTSGVYATDEAAGKLRTFLDFQDLIDDISVWDPNSYYTKVASDARFLQLTGGVIEAATPVVALRSSNGTANQRRFTFEIFNATAGVFRFNTSNDAGVSQGEVYNVNWATKVLSFAAIPTVGSHDITSVNRNDGNMGWYLRQKFQGGGWVIALERRGLGYINIGGAYLRILTPVQWNDTQITALAANKLVLNYLYAYNNAGFISYEWSDVVPSATKNGYDQWEKSTDSTRVLLGCIQRNSGSGALVPISDLFYLCWSAANQEKRTLFTGANTPITSVTATPVGTTVGFISGPFQHGYQQAIIRGEGYALNGGGVATVCQFSIWLSGASAATMSSAATVGSGIYQSLSCVVLLNGALLPTYHTIRLAAYTSSGLSTTIVGGTYIDFWA